MQIQIKGKAQPIHLKFRQVEALLDEMGAETLEQADAVFKKINLKDIPRFIQIALHEDAKRKNDKAKAPDLDDVRDGIDDNPALVGEFLRAFSAAVTTMFGGVEADGPGKAAGAGN